MCCNSERTSKAAYEAQKCWEDTALRGTGGLSPRAAATPRKMGNTRGWLKVREESWRPLCPLTMKCSSSLAGECGRPRSKPGLQVRGDEPAKTGVLTRGQHPGWETWDPDRSNQNVGVDFLSESWQVPVGEPQSWLRGFRNKAMLPSGEN